MKRRSTAGFTLIELLMVTIVLGLLTAIALLKFIDVRATAKTTTLAGDVRAVTVAAFNYYADHEAWPPESTPGRIPPGLESYLSGGLASSFERPEYLLDWENLMVGGEPLVGVAVTTDDIRLRNKFITTFGYKTPFFINADKLTYLIAGPGGVF